MSVHWLFDLHACLHFIRHGAGEFNSQFERAAPGEIAISSLTLAALQARARNSHHPTQNRRALEQFVLPLVVVDFDAEAAHRLGALAANAEAKGRTAGQEEMLAAQALCLHAELVTNRPDLYRDMDGLQVRVIGTQTTESPSQGHLRQIRIAGSQDFTLDLLASWLHAQDPSLSLTLDSVGSLRGLLALGQKAAHLAGSHLLDEETGDFNRGYIQHLLTPLGVRVVLLGFVEREQGLIVTKGNPKRIGRLADLVRDDVLFVNRQAGAGTRVLLDYHLRRGGLQPKQVHGYEREEPTHLAVAAAVADGRADCGLGVLAAARSLDLDFVPLFQERFDLVIPVEHYESPLLAPLLALLRHPQVGFVQQVAALGGYATGSMGKVLGEI